MSRIKLHFAAATLLTLCLLLGLNTAAQADSINSLSITGYTISNAVDVTVNGNHLGNKQGAQFSGTIDLGYGNFQDVIGYCIDLLQTVGTGTFTDYSLAAVSSSANYQAAAWLLGHYAPGLGNSYTGSLSTTITALQVAIWEVTYDYSAAGTYSLTSGNFYASNLDSGISSLATSYLQAMVAADTTQTGLGFSGALVSASHQDLIVGSPTSATPEPASMLLFGSAAGLMGWLRRRQGRKQQTAVVQIA
ncbi:MAG: PEP-CTERM sorting domain-containing protein [Pseudomonadota bacterium]